MPTKFQLCVKIIKEKDIYTSKNIKVYVPKYSNFIHL